MGTFPFAHFSHIFWGNKNLRKSSDKENNYDIIEKMGGRKC